MISIKVSDLSILLFLWGFSSWEDQMAYWDVLYAMYVHGKWGLCGAIVALVSTWLDFSWGAVISAGNCGCHWVWNGPLHPPPVRPMAAASGSVSSAACLNCLDQRRLNAEGWKPQIFSLPPFRHVALLWFFTNVRHLCFASLVCF